METPPSASSAAAKELLVTGVSRSGRVRKKSSKLLDFQSPDELEKKTKRTGKSVRNVGRGRYASFSGKGRRVFDDFDLTDDLGVDTDLLQEDFDADIDEHLTKAPISNIFGEADSDDEIDELVADLVEGVEAESMENSNYRESKVRHSLYMIEKTNKRKMLKDGKVITGKLERKDKGKSRYTAYSMWAREFRKTSKFSKNQDLDFSNAARRLGELWANVSNKEKSTWRRKAKMQATKAKARDKAGVPSTIAQPPTSNSFFNRATTSRTRKLEADRQTSPVSSRPRETPIPVKRKRNNTHKSDTSSHQNSPGQTSSTTTKSNQLSSSSSTPHTKSESKIEFCSTSVINSAAHLKLLGESLTIIGERLKEHEGQIAVSGSLSVLLDSLLCSMGPLMCLTAQIPGMKIDEPLKESLEHTLDNIAYIMPGL